MTASYERQPKESPRAFAAFAAYRDMGAARSIEKVREKLDKKSGYSRQLQEWSSVHRWVERAREYDETSERAIREKVDARYGDKIANARVKIITDELEEYERQLDKYAQVWERTQLHERGSEHKLPTGEKVKLVQVAIDEWRELLRWRLDISFLGRRAVGLPDRVTQADVTSGGDKLDTAALSVDDFMTVFTEIAAWQKEQTDAESADAHSTP